MILPHYSTSLQVGASTLFALSIVHIFLAPYFTRLYRLYQHKKIVFPEKWKRYLLFSELFKFIGRIELVFILWSIPLFFLFVYTEGYRVAMAYFNTRNYSFALFIMIMWVFLGSKPISYAAEHTFAQIANLGRQSPKSWWLTVMLVAPLSTIFLKETGAIIIATTLLAKYFYDLLPSSKFAYATMGLLFSNISIGGLLTVSSSRSLSIVSPVLRWSNYEVIINFGWKSLLAICVSTLIYYYLFRGEFKTFPSKVSCIVKSNRKIPLWVIGVHILFLYILIHFRSTPVLMGGVLVLFLFFHRLTLFYQRKIDLLKIAFLGLFFIGISFLGGLQEWWILNLIKNMSDFGCMLAAYLLSIFLDNVLVNLMMHDIPVVTDCYLYLVISGCAAAGGLTLISNIPNVVGYSALRPFFQTPSFSFWKLFAASLFPSMIAFLIFWVFRGIPELKICLFQ